MNKPIYLDHAATTPIDPAVLAAMKPYLEDAFANPSSVYNAARTTRQALEDARRTVADLLGAKPTEIIFTSGGTEGDNLAVQGVLRAIGSSAHMVTTVIEHDAILSQLEPLQRQGFGSSIVGVKASGIVSVPDIEAAITDETVLVSVMLANNEIGTIQPVADLAKAVHKMRLSRAARGLDVPLYLHTDACQAPAYLGLHVERLGIDLMTLNGSKIYGPKGSGVLYVRHGTPLEPLMFGGGQERGRRSGTENVAAAVGFAKALERAVHDHDTQARRQTLLRDDLIKRLTADIPGLMLNGHATRRLAGNINVTIPGAQGEALVLYLDNAGIMASTGSACSTGSLDPSHVLMAIGRTKDEAESSLRITLGYGTTDEDIRRVADVLPGIVKRVRELAT